MELTDDQSIQAWYAVIGAADSDIAAADPSPASSASSPAPAATAASPSAGTAGPSVSQASVGPAAFVPTGHSHVRILFKLSQPANVAICVLDHDGVVKCGLGRANDPAGWSSVWYYGYTTTGALFPAGTYPVIITAANSSGSTSEQTELTIGSGSSA